MKTKFQNVLPLLVILFSASTVFALSVDRIVLVPRKPDVYVRTISTALNSETGQTLVVWAWRTGSGVPESIRGQLLRSDGKPEGSSFSITSGSLNIGGPAVVFDPDAHQFVLAYAAKTSNTVETYAIRLKPNGRRKGKRVLVSHPSNPSDSIVNIWPVILYDSVNKAYAILWMRFTDQAPNPNDPNGIYGAVLNPNLSIRKKPVFIENVETGPGITFGPDISDAAIHPSGKILLTQILSTPVTYDFEFSVAQLDPTLQNPTAAITKLDKAPVENGCQFGICFEIKLMQSQGGEMAVLYSHKDGIRKRKISPEAVPLKATKFFPEPLRNEPLKINGSAFSVSTTSKEIAVLGFFPSEIDDAQFWLQLANSKGKPTGSPIQIESGVDCIHGGIISALPSNNSADHIYAVLYREGERDSPPLVNLGVGLVLLRVNTAP